MKFIGSISSILMGIFTFVFLSIPCYSVTIMGVTGTSSGWNLLSGNGAVMYKIFAILAIIMACLMILYGILLLLEELGAINLNIKKVNFDFVTKIVLSIFAFIAVMTLIGVFVAADNGAAGAGVWLLAAFAIVACALVWVLPMVTKKGK